MENIGKTYFLVIEPFDFDLAEQKVFYSDFGFVIVSESKFFRDSMMNFCRGCHKLRRYGFSPRIIITSIRKTMKNLVRNFVKTEKDILELTTLPDSIKVLKKRGVSLFFVKLFND